MEHTHPYAVRVTTCARHQLNGLSLPERTLVEAHLLQLAVYAADHGAPPGERFVRDRTRTPIGELRVWPFVILYEETRSERALTVLHVLRLPNTSDRPAAGRTA